MRFWRVPEIRLSALGFLLNGVWEFLHSPLYTDHARGFRYVLWDRLHCTAGDVLILLGAFWITSLVFRTRSWAISRRIEPMLVFVAIGFAYTIFSEWRSTRVTGAWQYAPDMPQILGFGLTPLLQWIVIPSYLLILLSREKLWWAGRHPASPTPPSSTLPASHPPR